MRLQIVAISNEREVLFQHFCGSYPALLVNIHLTSLGRMFSIRNVLLAFLVGKSRRLLQHDRDQALLTRHAAARGMQLLKGESVA
ncbi:hypothetical protein A5906_30765 [Bradyrhizobium sacchari]|nr:hypothetical protein A5906_30765 [Bradyrhizobium sacchari]